MTAHLPQPYELSASQVVVDMVVIDAMTIKTKGEYILFVMVQRQYYLIFTNTDALCLYWTLRNSMSRSLNWLKLRTPLAICRKYLKRSMGSGYG